MRTFTWPREIGVLLINCDRCEFLGVMKKGMAIEFFFFLRNAFLEKFKKKLLLSFYFYFLKILRGFLEEIV